MQLLKFLMTAAAIPLLVEAAVVAPRTDVTMWPVCEKPEFYHGKRVCNNAFIGLPYSVGIDH